MQHIKNASDNNINILLIILKLPLYDIAPPNYCNYVYYLFCFNYNILQMSESPMEFIMCKIFILIQSH